MPTPSKGLYDFALLASADLGLELLAGQLQELAVSSPMHPPTVELYGRAATGDVIVLCRFPFAAYSAALRLKMTSLAKRLGATLIETELLGSTERERFYAERLAGLEVRVDATAEPFEAARAFRGRMGLDGNGGAFHLQFASEDNLAAAWARCVAGKGVFVPTRRLPAEGDKVPLVLSIPGHLALEATGLVREVVEGDRPGFHTLFESGEPLQAFIARYASAAKTGRRLLPDGGRRRHPRTEVCLDIKFAGHSELAGEYAANISRGGLFVRTTTPPPMGAQVQVRLTLPDGEVVETPAEVVHVVTGAQVDEAHPHPGAGVSFSSAAEGFHERIQSYLDSVPLRRPRVLLVDDDRFFLQVLSDALGAADMEVKAAGDGKQAFELIAQELFELDVVLLDLHMPELDGYSLIDRVRRVGGELDLRIVVLSATTEEELAGLKSSGLVNDAIRKGTPLDEIVRRIERVLGS